MASCDYYIELLSAGLDGQLSPEQEQELAEHLLECPYCREIGPQLAATHAAFADLEEISAPDGFAEGVMARIRAGETKPKVVPLFKRPAWKAAAGFAACCVLCLGLYQTGLLGGHTRTETAGTGQPAMAQERNAAVEAETFAEGKTQHSTYTLDGAVQAVVLERLPEGSEQVFDGEIPRERDSAGNAYVPVSGVQLVELLRLAEQEGIELPQVFQDEVAAEAVYFLYITE